MFAIYTPEGRAFLGTLEHMRRVEKTSATSPAGAIPGSETDSLENEFHHNFSISKKATAQYRSLLQQDGQREPVYHAYQIMSINVQLLHASWTISQAMDLFRQNTYQLFPVVNHRQQLTGVLSRIQLYELLLDSDKHVSINTDTIGNCFIGKNTRVYSADPVTDVRRITAVLVEKNLHAMPIVDDTGTIVGIVSRSDILRCAINDPPLSLWC